MSTKFTVVYDACVLYPAPLRDLLMHLAVTDLFKAHWTDAIHEEWINALILTQGRERSTLERVKQLMDAHVSDAKVEGYEYLIETLSLPDPDDRHVLAASIRCHANAIVTFNLKDFPVAYLRQFAIEVLHPDDFIYAQLDLAPALVCKALQRQRKSLKNPPKTVQEFLAILQKQQLVQTVHALKDFADLI